MASFKQLQNELNKFGLTTKQAEVYLLLVKHKELRIQEIVTFAKMPRSSVYECLRVLYELGIAEEVIENNFKKIRPYSVGVMRHGLDEQMLQLKRLVKDLGHLEEAIAHTPIQAPPGSTTIRYYKGRSGARQLYWNSLKAESEVYVCSDWGRGRYVGMRYYERFVAETRARKIRESVLINPKETTLESIRTYTYPGSPISRTRIEDIKAIEQSDVDISGDTLMYDNIYAHVYLKGIEIEGFEIESEEFCTTQRSIFEVLWRQATPITDILQTTK